MALYFNIFQHFGEVVIFRGVWLQKVLVREGFGGCEARSKLGAVSKWEVCL